ncbi:MAG: hypothetical protein E5V22_07745 [Mesorhizobium sp.]|nr:MAG: hypothetical protein E5V22_07745 [Mesorhizobium sp.]
MRKVAVQMVIGGDDLQTWEITIKPEDDWWMPGADLAGATRNDRIRSLKGSLERHGVEVQLDVVPGIAHNDRELIAKVKEFFARTLNAAPA